MHAGGVGRGPQPADQIRVLLNRPQPLALAVHGVLDVEPDRADPEQAVDQPLGRLAVARLDVHRNRHIDRGGDLGDAGEQVVERHALAVGLAHRVGHGMAADRQRREPGVDRQVGRPCVPHRRKHHRITGSVQVQQCHRALCKVLLGGRHQANLLSIT